MPDTQVGIMPGKRFMKQNRIKRFREQQQFWLDLNKPDEAALSKKIAKLKEDREFASTVRQGLVLMMALRQGDISVLDEMFPQIADEIFQAGVDSTKVDSNTVEEKLTALAAMVKQLSVSPKADSGPKPLLVSGNLKSSQPTIHQDDFLEIKQGSSQKGNAAAENLINSLLRSTTIKSDKTSRPSKKKQQDNLIEIVEGK
jgi:hypothetical protein